MKATNLSYVIRAADTRLDSDHVREGLSKKVNQIVIPRRCSVSVAGAAGPTSCSFQTRDREKKKKFSSQDVCAPRYESNQENHLKLITWQPAGGSYQARGCVQAPDGRRNTGTRQRVNISCGQTHRQKSHFFFLSFFYLVMEAAESPLVPPSFCLPFQSRQTEGSRSNCILQDADLHFLLHFDETAAELSASISSPSDFTPRSDNSGCVCVHACLFAYGLSLCSGVCASSPAMCVLGCVCLNCFKVMSLRHLSRENVYF